ncbi:DEAD/DEAH box helicase [Sutcliffiella cohnii]
MNINLIDDLLDSFSPSTYDRGLGYYYNNNVYKLEFVGEINSWVAIVAGSSNYHVTITTYGDFSCTCKAFEKYEECKHIAATLFEIEDLVEENHINQKEINASTNFNISENMISALSPLALFNENILNEENSTPLKIQFHLKMHPSRWSREYFSISIKVGEDRLYVVKDITEFLQSINDNEELSFTNFFTYDPSKHVFSNEDQPVMDLLCDIWKSEEFIRENNNHYVSTSNNKEIKIPPSFLQRLLILLQNCDFQFLNNGKKYTNTVLEEEKKPFYFPIKIVNDEVSLDIRPISIYDYLSEYKLIVIDNEFYPLNKETEQIVNQLFQLLNRHNNDFVPINKANLDKFFAHVVPSLKKIGEVVVEDSITNQLLQTPLEIKIFLDYEEDYLLFKCELHYGEHIFDPFEIKDNSIEVNGQKIVRDLEKERLLIEALNQSKLATDGEDIFISKDDHIYHFLFSTLPKYEQFATVYLTDRVKSIIYQPKIDFSFDVQFKENESLLDIEFELSGIEPNDVKHVMASIKEKKRYHRLSNGSFIQLNEGLSELEEIYEKLGDLGKISDNKLSVPSYRAMQVESLLTEKTVDQKTYNEAFQQLVQQLKNPESLTITVPHSLQAELRDYQLVGYKWLKTLSTFGFGGILADDMGLGKTLQSITYLLAERLENPDSQPALVVTPSSLVYNWKYELERFAPSLKIAVVSGTKAERKETFTSDKDIDVYITSYPLIRQDSNEWNAREFSILLLDEAQAIKNDTTKIAKTIKSLQAAKKFALSGTPIENSLNELWSIFDCILPGFFPTKKKFQSLDHEKIAMLTKPFILRRLKTDVLHELPEKIESVQLSELTKEQKQLYLAYLEKIRGETKDALSNEGFQKSRMKILAGLTRLRQICCHPSLFLENYEGDSSKLSQLMEMVQNSIENGQRILIFSQFSSMLQIIKTQLDRNEIDSFYLDGSTPSKDRVEMANAFNNGERNVFLISLKAGGTGLNLTGADTVILYDLWWNPAVEEQAAARAHRMGQKKVVQVFRLITEGTIEEKIYKLQQKKKELVDAIIQPGEANFSSLSEKEILELLS